MFVLAGAEALLDEPDVRFVYGKEWVGIAAKRVRSQNPAQLLKNVRKAIRQIENSGIRGWIAINLDSRFESISSTGDRPVVLQRFGAVFDTLNSLLDRLVRNENVLGIMLYGYVSEWVFPSDSSVPALNVSMPMRWLGWADEPSEVDLFNAFTQGFRSRVDARLRQLAGRDPLP
jgi:hypothetical protein